MSTRSRAASRPSPLASTPQTQTSPPRRQTPRKSVLNLQTHLQMCPVYRRTSAGWPTTVSPPFFFLNRKSLFKCLFYVQWQHRVFLLCFSPVHATLKSTFSSLVAERDRLRHTIDLHAPQPGQVMGLKTAYASVSVSMTQKIPVPHDYTTNPPITTGLILQKRLLMLIRNVQAALTHWSTRRPMRAKHLSQSPYQSFSMLRSTCCRHPPLRMRWEIMNYLLDYPSRHMSHPQQGFHSS